MIVCVGIYIILIYLWRRQKKEIRKLFWIIFLANSFAMLFFLSDLGTASDVGSVARNGYGEGGKTEQYEVTVEGELEQEPISIEVEERAYTKEEIKVIFKKMLKRLDKVILGANKSADYVEYDLKLVDKLADYPVEISWEISDYEVFDTEGHIVSEEIPKEGVLVAIKGYLRYGEQEAMYGTNVRVYPRVKTGKEGWIARIEEQVKRLEEESRIEERFHLPQMIDGKEISWEKPEDRRGYWILIFGIVVGGLLIWNDRKEIQEKKQERREQMERDYPNIISSFVMLLHTGMTVKQIWMKVVENYELQKEDLGERAAYEEMKRACHEMQQGVSEVEVYERFGSRCDNVLYLKFGALLSQNLRKGSTGIGELLKMESIQAFEMRKSTAKRKGEEAGTKLMLPMMGMLGVVMVMVIVPAFLSMQI